MRKYVLIVGALLGGYSYTAIGETSATLDEVVVKDTHTENDLAIRQHHASSKITYGRDELEKTQELTVGDYLRKLPGVTYSGPPGNPKDIRMRGLDKGYTQILINGEIPPSGTKENQLQVDRLTLDMIERIEVIRAPTADIRNEGIGGTINIVLKAAPEKSIFTARVGTGVLKSSDHSENPNQVSLQYGNTIGNFSFLLAGAVNNRYEIKTNEKNIQGFNALGIRNKYELQTVDEQNEIQEINFAPRFTWRLTDKDTLNINPYIINTDEDKTQFQQKFKYGNALLGTDLQENGEQNAREQKERDLKRLDADWTHRTENGSIVLRVLKQQGTEDKYKTQFDSNALGVVTKETFQDTKSQEDFDAVRFRWNEAMFESHFVSAGLEREFKTFEDESQTIENGVLKNEGSGTNFKIRENRWIAWLQDEWAINESHILTPGVRWQKLEQKGSADNTPATSNDLITTSPSLHYLWKINEANNLRASLSHSVRVPKLDELSPITQLELGTVGKPDKGGNPDLNPEEAVGAELGIEHFFSNKSGLVGMNLFYRNVKDLIEKNLLEEDGRFVERPDNVGDGEIWGVEFDARKQMDFIGMPNLLVRANYSWLRSRVRDISTGDTRKFKDQPDYVYNIGFDYDIPSWNASFGMNYNYIPDFIKDPVTGEGESNQKLLDLYAVKRINKNFNVRLTASNLLNMKKVKYKPGINATTGALTSLERDEEQGAVLVFLAVESRW